MGAQVLTVSSTRHCAAIPRHGKGLQSDRKLVRHRSRLIVCRPHSSSPPDTPSSRNTAQGSGSSTDKAGTRRPTQDINILTRPHQAPAALNETFQWHKQWYPLVPISYVDHSRPKAMIVLGHNLVVWRHAPTSTWQCFEDKCPHRLAPLSEGRIEPSTGNLMCSYHGWQFGMGGACRSIPQADSPQQEAVALGSPRACVASYPVKEEQGLLWVWMDSGADAALESSVRPVGLPSELLDGTGVLLGDWYMRDLPVSYEYLLENLVDPSHVFFAHHGIIGTRDRGGPMRLVQQGGVSAQGGFAVRIEQTGMAGGMPAVTRFLPPSLTWLSYSLGGGPAFSMLFYAVPQAPGHSRLFAGYSTPMAPSLVRRAMNSGALTPLLHSFQWAADLGAHEVIDGDTLFLRRQEERSAASARAWASSPYFMPASCDRGVVLLRRWLKEFAGGGPAFGPAAVATGQSAGPLSREQILDRFEQHTKTCPHCSRALRNIQTLRGGLGVATTSCFAAGVALAALQASLLPLPLGSLSARGSAPFLLLTGSIASALLNQALGRLEERFVFTDYTHWDK